MSGIQAHSHMEEVPELPAVGRIRLRNKYREVLCTGYLLSIGLLFSFCRLLFLHSGLVVDRQCHDAPEPTMLAKASIEISFSR